MKNVTKKGLPIYTLILILFVILLTACSAGVPSESNAKSVFENQRSKEIKKGILKIDSFSETNIQKMNVLGVEAYKVYYKANVTYPKGVMPECARAHQFSWDCFNAQGLGIVFKKPGKKETINGGLVFEKTEKGWKGEDGRIY